MGILKCWKYEINLLKTRRIYLTLYINIQFVPHREFIVLQLKRTIDEYRTKNTCI